MFVKEKNELLSEKLTVVNKVLNRGWLILCEYCKCFRLQALYPLSNINISTTLLSKCLTYNSINDSVSDFTLTNKYKSIYVETFAHKKECKNNIPQNYVIKKFRISSFFRRKTHTTSLYLLPLTLYWNGTRHECLWEFEAAQAFHIN